MKNPCPFDAFTRSHLGGPVILSLVFVSNVLRSVPDFVSFSFTFPVCEVSLLSGQIFPILPSLLPSFLRRDVKRDFQL